MSSSLDRLWSDGNRKLVLTISGTLIRLSFEAVAIAGTGPFVGELVRIRRLGELARHASRAPGLLSP
jgi:hypothetical protein